MLRSALSLAAITGRPLRLERIRARRAKPGLRQQHLTAVRAAASVCSATLQGAELGAAELEFVPGEAAPGGDYRFSVGTAGSACLVLQTVLPPLLLARGPSTVWLEGGTHNMMAPPFEFLQQAFLPLLGRMGAAVELSLHQAGFYPAGGGSMTARVSPGSLSPLELPRRGELRRLQALALVAGVVPDHVGRRELKVVRQELGWDDLQLQRVDSRGPGNVLLLELAFEHVTEVVCGFGKRGVRAEVVAARAVKQARAYLEAEAPVGPHLADQLLLPLALAGGGAFKTVALTEHSRTNMEIIRRFLKVEFRCQELSGGEVELVVES